MDDICLFLIISVGIAGLSNKYKIYSMILYPLLMRRRNAIFILFSPL